MPPTRPAYPPEFKTEAVRLYRESGKSLQETASNLGVSTNSLREWVRRVENGGNARDINPSSLTSDEREELKRLQRENRVLREEREILKKAAAKSSQREVSSFNQRA